MVRTRQSMKGLAMGWRSFEIFCAHIGYMIVTLFIQVQARLRFKSGTDPSVRPSLIGAITSHRVDVDAKRPTL